MNTILTLSDRYGASVLVRRKSPAGFLRSALLLSVALSIIPVGDRAIAQTSSATQASAVAASNSTVSLKSVVVKGNRFGNGYATRSTNPGGLSTIDVKSISSRHLTTYADLLASQPGVFVQGAGNTGAPKISIQGSGIDQGHLFFRQGIDYLFDGLPLTGSSGTPFELWDPQILNGVTILRGPAGIEDGSTEAGGAIDFDMHTGYDSPSYSARVDAGSYGYLGEQLSTAKVLGKLDYYLSVTNFRAQNFAGFSSSRATRVAADIGYKFNDKVSTRFFFHYGTAYEQENYGISLAQIKSDPRILNPLNLADNTQRENAHSFWVGDKTTIKIDPSSTLTFGLDYHSYPIVGPGILLGTTDWTFQDLGYLAEYKRSDQIADHASVTTFHVIGTKAIDSFTKAYQGGGSPNTVFSPANLIAITNFDGSGNVTFGATNNFNLTNDLVLTTEIAGVNYQINDNYTFYTLSNTYPNASSKTDGFDWEGLTGLTYNVTGGLQAFGSAGRTIQLPRAFDSTNYAASTTYAPVGPLKPENLLTYELGLRGSYGIFSGSADVYHSQIDNELLSYKLNPADAFAVTNNASATFHQGVEVGLNTLLWHGPQQGDSRDDLSLNQTYNYSDFHYEHDATFGKNQLPGVPPNFWSGELIYHDHTGFYAAVNGQYASSYYVDYANTFRNPAYALLGARLGYTAPDGKWDSYLQFKNLTNVHYASSVLTQYDLHGQDSNFVFYPGDGFSVLGGIAVNY